MIRRPRAFGQARRRELDIVPIAPPGPPLVCGLGDGTFKVPIQGGWTTVARERRVGLSDFAGQDPLVMSGPLILDNRGESVEHLYTRLERLCRDVAPDGEPTRLRLRGPIPYTDRRWVIQSVTPNGEWRRTVDGQRIRVVFDIEFLEYVPADLLVTSKASPAEQAAERAIQAAPAEATARTYTVNAGDTLSAIAARELGAASRWHEIADLNGIRDPRTLQIGQVLRLP